ncbi:MAG: Pup--protein ligase [Actinomycetota bacterium]
MRRRIFGIETEYGVTHTLRGQRRLSPDEVARALFRDVVAWGRSSNVFLENGGRLYLDVGSHPEYATPECASAREAVLHDLAGSRILERLVLAAEGRLSEEGIVGRVGCFRNNTDSAGNSYGSHENYLVERDHGFARLTDALIPFLVSRQVFAGAGKVLAGPEGARFVLSQRSDHVWEGVSSATTRSRPIINTRDEPHADPERYRRLHVIVGDSNMSEYAAWLRLATTDLVIRALEESPVSRELTLEDPIRAVREISRDPTGTRRVRVANGREMTGLEIQQFHLEQVERHVAANPDAEAEHVVAEWRTTLEGLVRDPMTLADRLDWVAKLELIDAVRARHGLALGDPRVALIDLAYHDVVRERGLHHLRVRHGRTRRLVPEDEVERATTEPPETTRAALRGRFIREAKRRGRDFTVDWVHLKLNDQAQRTVLCKDPLRSVDERVDRLIAAM